MTPIDSPHPANNKRLDMDYYSLPSVYTFITIRAYQYTRPFRDPALSSMVVHTLLEEESRLGCQIWAYCLMPDHVHFLISPVIAGCSVLKYTDQFKGKTTRLSWGLGWKGKLWQPRYYDHILGKEEDWKSVAEYILINPVRKGWVSDWTEWQRSGLRE